MKAIFYICLVLGALVLPASKGVRDAAIGVVTAVASGIERLVIRGDYAEVRLVDGDEFEKVIREKDRLVIVAVRNELTASSRSETQEIDGVIKRLPATVLVAKVIAERNMELLKRLKIPSIPNMRIYSNGLMVKEFRGRVDKAEFKRVVEHYLENPVGSGGGTGPTIIPMKEDWMPDGVEEKKVPSVAPMTPLR